MIKLKSIEELYMTAQSSFTHRIPQRLANSRFTHITIAAWDLNFFSMSLDLSLGG